MFQSCTTGKRGTAGKETEALFSDKMMSIAARSGAFSPYLQATNFAVAGPLKPLVAGVVIKSEKVLLDAKQPFLTRESLSGKSPTTGPALSASITGKSNSVQRSSEHSGFTVRPAVKGIWIQRNNTRLLIDSGVYGNIRTNAFFSDESHNN